MTTTHPHQHRTAGPALDLGKAALDLAYRGRAVLPLKPRGKDPASALVPRGFHQATADPWVIRQWWTRVPDANIGAVIPRGLVVIDVDPRNGGAGSLAALVAEHGPLPATQCVASGRGDGGRHLYYRRPPGPLVTTLGAGLDVKSDGYCVAPPSLHPDTGQPYTWTDGRPPTPVPLWLATLLREPEPLVQEQPRPGPVAARPGGASGWRSPAEEFNVTRSWSDVLAPHGWVLVKGDGDSDRSGWRHPAATSACSATVVGGRLYCWSPNTPLPLSEPGRPHGVSRIEAYALLEHGGNVREALRALRRVTK